MAAVVIVVVGEVVVAQCVLKGVILDKLYVVLGR